MATSSITATAASHAIEIAAGAMLNTSTVESAAIIRQRSDAVPSFVRQNCATIPSFLPKAVLTQRIPPSSIDIRKHASMPNILLKIGLAPSIDVSPPPVAALSIMGIVTKAPRIMS